MKKAVGVKRWICHNNVNIWNDSVVLQDSIQQKYQNFMALTISRYQVNVEGQEFFYKKWMMASSASEAAGAGELW